jgi:hypothetical protein
MENNNTLLDVIPHLEPVKMRPPWGRYANLKKGGMYWGKLAAGGFGRLKSGLNGRED